MSATIKLTITINKIAIYRMLAFIFVLSLSLFAVLSAFFKLEIFEIAFAISLIFFFPFFAMGLEEELVEGL